VALGQATCGCCAAEGSNTLSPSPPFSVDLSGWAVNPPTPLWFLRVAVWADRHAPCEAFASSHETGEKSAPGNEEKAVNAEAAARSVQNEWGCLLEWLSLRRREILPLFSFHSHGMYSLIAVRIKP
jgi:hypothetical protein